VEKVGIMAGVLVNAGTLFLQLMMSLQLTKMTISACVFLEAEGLYHAAT